METQAQSTHRVVSVDLNSDLDIGRKLGKGTYGVVYEGRWKNRGGMRVAIKKTPSSESLEEEIKVWSSLPQHPNIVILLGVASSSFDTYLVTELATNGSLYNFLYDDKKTPTEDQSLAWALDIARAMKHLHDHDVIHRDLKSANVLFSDTWVVKVCDFGTARKLTHTTTTAQAGTYRWMAPEIMRAVSARINKKCDLFSYGMILFELFAHKVPYSDIEYDHEVMDRACKGDRPPLPRTLPPYLHNTLKSCWEEDPSKRPTFEEILGKITSK